MTKRTLLSKVTKLKALKAQVKSLEEEIEVIENQIKEEMNSKGKEELKAGIFTIKLKQFTQNRFDSKAFKEKYIDLYNQFAKVKETTRLTIS